MRNNHEYTLQERKQAEIDAISMKIAIKKREKALINEELNLLQQDLDRALSEYTSI